MAVENLFYNSNKLSNEYEKRWGTINMEMIS